MNFLGKQFGRIGVLMGGVSSERDISLKSGKAVFEALTDEGLDVVALDISEREKSKVIAMIRDANIDLAFNVLHGEFGEDGEIQSLLDAIDMTYTGSGVEASRLSMNKILTQDLLKANGLSVPRHVVLSKKSPIDLKQLTVQLGGFPMVVKPDSEGSSIGVTLVHYPEKIESALEEAWRYSEYILIEEYIKGRELTVGILGQKALPVVEICPKDQFYDFGSKYTSGATDFIIPAGISQEVASQLQKAALETYNIIGCEGCSRIDFMLDQNQKHYILEINTIPGFTSTSLLPKAAQQAGINFNQLCLRLVEFAYGKKNEVNSKTSAH